MIPRYDSPPFTEGGWKWMVASLEYHMAASKELPGWDRDSDGKQFQLNLRVVKGKTMSSHTVACQWDDLATERFYYRDWTDSGLPFVDDGGQYMTGFVFARRMDYELFREKYDRDGTTPPISDT